MTIPPLGRNTLVGFALVACLAGIATAEQRATPSPGANASAEGDQKVVRVLQSVLGPPDSDVEPRDPTRYTLAFADLNGDGRAEALAYITGGGWCGSGGCHLLVLTPAVDSYRVVGRTTITRPPIRVLTTRTRGWRDIGVWVQGGGIQTGYEAALPFNGTKYQANPSVSPARPLRQNAAGETVIGRDANEAELFR